MDEWTTQRVLGLAPDASSAKSGRDLGKAAKWNFLGRAEAALWGEIKGSGKQPYRVRVDLTEPAFKCSCPSRKFPCKHALGLMLVLAEDPAAMTPGAAPAWLSEWLTERAARRQQRIDKAQAQAEQITDPPAQAKRAAQRKAKVDAGVDELRLWLSDLLRGGLAAAQTRPHALWSEIAARMIDAQAPGLARLVRKLASHASSGAGWQSRLLAEAGRLHLLLEAYRRLDDLPEPLRADVQGLIGWTVSHEELLSQAGVRDAWTVVGRVVEEEDRLKVQRTWLLGCNSGRMALVLHFAAASQVFDTSLVPRTCVDAEIVFFPGAAPLRRSHPCSNASSPTASSAPTTSSRSAPMRGIIKLRHGIVPRPELTGTSIDDGIAARAAALTQCPWIERWPLVLGGIVPSVAESEWTLSDRAGRILPIQMADRVAWQLLSISGGAPVGAFGEWDGQALSVLSAWSGDDFYALASTDAGARLQVA